MAPPGRKEVFASHGQYPLNPCHAEICNLPGLLLDVYKRQMNFHPVDERVEHGIGQFCAVTVFSDQCQKTLSIRSVSYTHLDVYKRQAVKRQYKQSRNIAAQYLHFYIPTQYPVSYTHLDVYKRQLLRFGLQQLVEGFLYASAHKFLELPLDNFFV